MAINLVKKSKSKTTQEHLLEMFFAYKYFNACCEDEAIDWSQHPMSLNVKELEEYTQWEKDYLTAVKIINKLTGYNRKVFYALQPWSAEKEGLEVVVNNK